MKQPYSFQGYDPKKPLKDNLTQVKNFAELFVAVMVAIFLQSAETYLIQLFGSEIASQIVLLVNMVETGIVYYAISAIEYWLKEE